MSMKVTSHRRHRERVKRLKDEINIAEEEFRKLVLEYEILKDQYDIKYPKLTLIQTISKWFKEGKVAVS